MPWSLRTHASTTSNGEPRGTLRRLERTSFRYCSLAKIGAHRLSLKNADMASISSESSCGGKYVRCAHLCEDRLLAGKARDPLVGKSRYAVEIESFWSVDNYRTIARLSKKALSGCCDLLRAMLRSGSDLPIPGVTPME